MTRVFTAKEYIDATHEAHLQGRMEALRLIQRQLFVVLDTQTAVLGHNTDSVRALRYVLLLVEQAMQAVKNTLGEAEASISFSPQHECEEGN